MTQSLVGESTESLWAAPFVEPGCCRTPRLKGWRSLSSRQVGWRWDLVRRDGPWGH